MQNSTLKEDLENFADFAAQRIARGINGDSVEDLVRQWRENTESAQAVADVRQGLADDANGMAEPASAAFADVRRRLVRCSR